MIINFHIRKCLRIQTFGTPCLKNTTEKYYCVQVLLILLLCSKTTKYVLL